MIWCIFGTQEIALLAIGCLGADEMHIRTLAQRISAGSRLTLCTYEEEPWPGDCLFVSPFHTLNRFEKASDFPWMNVESIITAMRPQLQKIIRAQSAAGLLSSLPWMAPDLESVKFAKRIV